jgi:hypothetical protein
MRGIAYFLGTVVALAGVVVCMGYGSGQAGGEAAPIFGIKIPSGYRDWKLISVAHEAGNLNDFRAILGNDIAIAAYREQKLPLPRRRNYCPAGLELRLLRGKQQSLWP